MYKCIIMSEDNYFVKVLENNDTAIVGAHLLIVR